MDADYKSELDFCIRLVKAIELIVKVCEEHPVKYPMLMSDVVTLLYGRKVPMKNGQFVLCNGLDDQIREMYDTLAALELEVLYEGSSDELHDAQEGGSGSL